jgi:hypothetical protein
MARLVLLAPLDPALVPDTLSDTLTPEPLYAPPWAPAFRLYV